MLTVRTQKALAILRDISIRSDRYTSKLKINGEEISSLLLELEEANLIHLMADKAKGQLNSYCLSRPLSKISLLSLLSAINENVDCTQPLTEEFYNHYGSLAHKLGVINQVTRSLLDEISILECI